MSSGVRRTRIKITPSELRVQWMTSELSAHGVICCALRDPGSDPTGSARSGRLSALVVDEWLGDDALIDGSQQIAEGTDALFGYYS